VLLGLATLVAGAAGAQAADAATGQHLAETWCSGCHRVGAIPDRRTARDAVPDFAAIARMPSTTPSSLNAWLNSQHQAMPDFRLTRDQVQDVSAYILSLRRSSPARPPGP
jgi:mono/diheme cytochrome c family protein